MKGHTGEYPPGPAWLRPLALGNTTEDDTPAVPQAPAPRTRRWPGLVSTLFSALVLVAAGCLALAGLQVLQGKAAQPNLLAHILRGPATSNAHTLPTSGLAQAPEIADGAGVWLEGLPGLLQKPELPNGWPTVVTPMGVLGVEVQTPDPAVAQELLAAVMDDLEAAQ